MFGLGPATDVYLALGATDMRKGLLQIPAVWTDFLKSDAFVEVAAARSALHADFLLELAELLEHVREEKSCDV